MGILCSPHREELRKFWKNAFPGKAQPQISADEKLGYQISVFGPCFDEAILKGAKVFPQAVRLSQEFAAKMRAEAAFKPNDPLMSVPNPPPDFNLHQIGVPLSDTYRYPIFPYHTQDQQFIVGPNYEKIADALVELCYKHDLILGARRHELGANPVWDIYFSDNSIMTLSDMQTMLVLQGMLKGFKRLIELDDETRSEYEEKLEIKRQVRWDKGVAATPVHRPPAPVPVRKTGAKPGRKTNAEKATAQLPPNLQSLLDNIGKTTPKPNDYLQPIPGEARSSGDNSTKESSGPKPELDDDFFI